MDKSFDVERVGIISAMREEIDALIQQMNVIERISLGGRLFYVGVLFEREVVLVFSHWGKVAASITATQLISKFNLSELIFTGVAGSIDSSIDIGDLIIGTTLIQHDMDASPLYPPQTLPVINLRELPSQNSAKIRSAAERTIYNLDSELNPDIIQEFNLQNTSLHSGLILTGDQFVSDRDTAAKLKSKFKEALCVEMEGAAVAQVCLAYDLPFSVIRIISDKADDNAEIEKRK
jgi:adenosylhomocysteine nucleosidase